MLDKKKKRYESILYLTKNSCFTNTYVFYDQVKRLMKTK